MSQVALLVQCGLSHPSHRAFADFGKLPYFTPWLGTPFQRISGAVAIYEIRELQGGSEITT